MLRATNDLDMFGFLTRPTLLLIDGQGAFDKAVIYAILHESIYCERYDHCHRNSHLVD